MPPKRASSQDACDSELASSRTPDSVLSVICLAPSAVVTTPAHHHCDGNQLFARVDPTRLAPSWTFT